MLCKLFFGLIVVWTCELFNTYYSHRPKRSDSMQVKVVGGVSVPIEMYPHVATVIFMMFPICGSSIITHRVTVTAGHCLFDLRTGTMKHVSFMDILVGGTVIGEGSMHEVCQIRAYPKYQKGDIRYPRYDIGLILVKKPFQFGPKVQKIPLVRDEQWKKEKYTFTMAGFGTVSSEGAIIGHTLLSTRMRYVDFDVCRQIKVSHNYPIFIHEDVFCLIGSKWNSDCYGDSGSGIIWKKYLVGVVSAGLEAFCGSDMVPSIYTNIYYFSKWIKAEVKVLESSKKCEI